MSDETRIVHVGFHRRNDEGIIEPMVDEATEKDIEIDERTAVTVMLVSGGYPGAYPKGKTMSGFDQVEDSILFHAGTKQDGKNVVTAGGRVKCN